MKGRFSWLALGIALGLTLLMWRQTKLYKAPPPRTNVRMLMGAVGHLIAGHGCPSSLNRRTMACEDPSTFWLKMTFTCRPTGESLATQDVKDLWPREEDFIVLRQCNDAWVILWKPAHIAFGVRNLKIELMSRHLDQIMKLMCGGSPVAMPGADDGQTPEAFTLRPDEIGTPSPTTGPK